MNGRKSEIRYQILDFVINNNRLPNTSKRSPESEKTLGRWVNKQREAYQNKKNNKPCRAKLDDNRIKLLEEIPGWYWDKSEKSSNQPTPRSSASARTPSPPKPRSYLRPVPNTKGETSTSTQSKFNPPNLSELSTYHKTFKTLHSSTYFSRIQSNPEEFEQYHQLSKQAEQNDHPEDLPLNVISKFINELTPNQLIADLGCGDATLSTLCPRHKFVNFDVHALNDKIQVCNISKLPQKYTNYFDVVVLSRAMWATNKKDLLSEASRILKSTGKLYICEPFKRWNWNKEEGKFAENGLDQLLINCNFRIHLENKTRIINRQYPKFMYYVCQKSFVVRNRIIKHTNIDDLDKELEDLESFCKL